MAISDSTRTWFHGLAVAAISSFSGAAWGMLVLPDTFNFSEHGLANIGKMTLIPTGVAVFAYLKQSPLPGLVLQPGDKASIMNPVITPDGGISGSSATLTKAPAASDSPEVSK